MNRLVGLLPTRQATLVDSISCIGIGLHSGRKSSFTLHPAEPRSGIRFVRKGVESERATIPATWPHVVDTRLCTVLGNRHGITVATVEHLLAALYGCGIDNAIIEYTGFEIPILDGSSAAFVEMIDNAGIRTQDEPRRYLQIERPLAASFGDSVAMLGPARRPRISVSIDFEHGSIGAQRLELDLDGEVFRRQIAAARTFGFSHELESLREQGLAIGGSLRNAILLDDAGVVNPEGLRFADEFVRHKALDCLGDLALAGAPIIGHLSTSRPGHRLNNALLRQLFADRTAWRWTTLDRAGELIDAASPSRVAAQSGLGHG